MWGCENRKAAYICNRFQKMTAQKVHWIIENDSAYTSPRRRKIRSKTIM